MVLPFRLSFPSMLPTIVLSFPLGAEPAFTLPGVDPSAAVIPITYPVVDLWLVAGRCRRVGSHVESHRAVALQPALNSPGLMSSLDRLCSLFTGPQFALVPLCLWDAIRILTMPLSAV
jgi:hypothetical protein